jgi:pyridoxal 5'-phosphate synthase pdxT subunit
VVPVVRPVIGVFALQGDVREHVAALSAVGADAVPVRRPEELGTVDGLVVPGGESTTMSRLSGIFGLLEPIRARIAAGMPVYGSCAGMIMLASTVLDGRPDQQSFGGIDMVVRRNAFGRQVDSFEARVEADALGGPIDAVFIRAPRFRALFPDVEVLARYAGEPVLVRQGRVVAATFHPELTGSHALHHYLARLAETKAAVPAVRSAPLGDAPKAQLVSRARARSTARRAARQG